MADGVNAHGDDVYRPQDADQPAERQPDMENALDEPDLDRTLDEGYSPPDRPLAATRYGTTAEEQQAGETLDQRLAQEAPEADEVPAAQPAPEDAVGRLAAVGEAHPRRNIDVLARDVGDDAGGLSAEEAAMHVERTESGTEGSEGEEPRPEKSEAEIQAEIEAVADIEAEGGTPAEPE
ncbi:DUF5709 domain-containing protein [Streptomyces sp. NPDC003038]|uniref:DUF5709 domain-containing protein n=1 Tax=unclassified Streptomyces TaxID=2593676 RepID=UPI0033BDE1BC